MPEMDEAVLKKVLPHSIEAEQSVIGSMLMDKRQSQSQVNKLAGKIFTESSMVFFLTRWWN